MRRAWILTALALTTTACSDGGDKVNLADPSDRTEASTPQTDALTTTAVETTMPATTTTVEATTTTLAPTGSATACDGFLTLDDPDADGHGECIVTIEGAGQQYFVISGRINNVIEPMGSRLNASECVAYLQAAQVFIDDLKANVWPAEAQSAIDELTAASEYELFVRDDKCRGDVASINEAIDRVSKAVFEVRRILGVGTDFDA